VYQSSFSRDWWHAVWGDSRKPETVVYNGVDLDEFSPPEAPAETTGAGLLMVEGNLGGGYEIGLENGLALTAELNRRGAPIQLSVAGNAPPSLRAKFPEREFPFLRWLGVVGHAKLAGLYRSSGLFFSGDLNAACPNAVIEALACGLPVAAYATGALPEMLAGQGGLCVPWGADFWKLEQAAVGPLADAAEELLRDAATWRVRARNRAEAAFDIRRTAVAYLDVLFG